MPYLSSPKAMKWWLVYGRRQPGKPAIQPASMRCYKQGAAAASDTCMHGLGIAWRLHAKAI